MSDKKLKKAVVVLTNFWDAEKLLRDKFFLTQGSQNAYKFNLHKNFSVQSIALSSPTIDALGDLRRIDCFCPTYNMLKRYKKDGDWKSYTDDYYGLLGHRKDVIRDWIDDLQVGHIYILCCWEKTGGKAHCHRELLYKALRKSKTAKAKIFPVYRHGDAALDAVTSKATGDALREAHIGAQADVDAGLLNTMMGSILTNEDGSVVGLTVGRIGEGDALYYDQDRGRLVNDPPYDGAIPDISIGGRRYWNDDEDDDYGDEPE